MPKLHEILAVERGAQVVVNKLLNESLRTLSKDSLFKGMSRTLTHFVEDQRHLDNQESQALETTVAENIDYLAVPWANWVDTVLQKDSANMEATADVLIDGKIFLHGVPATTLLGLETKLSDLRKVLEAIPTLPPGVGWVRDMEQQRSGVYKSQNTTETLKEVKDTEYRKVAEATPEHPAQIEGVPIVKAIGKYTVSHQCGMMSPLEKAEHLTRLDSILKAIKRARARANDQETTDGTIGMDIFNYIRGNIE